MVAAQRSLTVQRQEQILNELARAYPDAECALNFQTPFQLLVATVLSAQTTDKRVNQITPELFATYPDPAALAQADLEEVKQLVRSLGFGSRRAQQLIALAQRLLEHYQGQVPPDGAALETLEGVGRKTANVVLGNAFGIPAITVDTHVGRLARRMGFTSERDPKKVETDLQQVIAPSEWTVTCHRLIEHGRAICQARKPKCAECVCARSCPRQGVE